jgi:hypothetical protein
VESSLQTQYQGGLRPPKNSQLDLKVWHNRPVDAACYDQGLQGLAVKELHQPGFHWSASRRFNPLWVIGIQLPGSYCFSEVDSRSKIMAIIDSLTPAVLEEAWKKLVKWLTTGIMVMWKENGAEWLGTIMSTHLATNPPMCVARLLRLARSDLNLERQETRLRTFAARVPEPACQALQQCIGKTREEPNMAETYAIVVLEELESRWTPDFELSPHLPTLSSK